MKNKVAVLEKPGKFIFEEREINIEDDEVMIAVKACGLCNWELNHFKGEYGSYPQVIGHEPAGQIVEVGKKIKEFKVGDRVTGLVMQAFAQYAVSKPENLVKVPQNVPIEFTLGEPLKCVTTISRAVKVEFGDYIAVAGCGFMGNCVLATLTGKTPAEIIAIDIDNNKLELAKRIGATVVINPKEEKAKEKIMDITHGQGLDTVVELTGGTAIFDFIGPLLKMRARLLVSSSHKRSSTINFQRWEEKGVTVYNVHPPFALDELDDLRRAIEGLCRGVFPMETLMTHRFSLEEIQKAFETLRNKPEGYIKGVVIP